MYSIKFKSRNLLPRTAWDIGSFGFLVIVIPLIFWFETCIVLPAFYSETYSFWRIYHNFISVFLLFQVVSNLIYLILTDTSIECVTTPSVIKEGWKYCGVCGKTSPPRSFHCHICEVCILKRDHHCRFSACCIGHYNYRFFLMFLLYLTISTTYATYFNIFFILNYINFNLGLLLKVMLPIAFLIFGVDTSTNHCYLILFIIIVIGSIVSVLLLAYHFTLVQYGLITHEKNHNIKGYDKGLKNNIEQVFGIRWHLVWIAPFIESLLPNNGMDWSTEGKSMKVL